jgi:hypothetical protein
MSILAYSQGKPRQRTWSKPPLYTEQHDERLHMPSLIPKKALVQLFFLIAHNLVKPQSKWVNVILVWVNTSKPLIFVAFYEAVDFFSSWNAPIFTP